jgi:hypothetical protein
VLQSVSFAGGWVGSVLRELAMWTGVLLLLAGCLSVYIGWKQRQKAMLVGETPRSKITDVQSSDIVRVRGTVVPEGEGSTFTSPIKGDPGTVLSAWEIDELYDTPKTRSWEAAACGVRSVPFYIEDESGRVLVDIDDRTVGNDTDDTFTPARVLESNGVSVAGLRCAFDSFDVHVETDYGESPPPRVAEFVDATDGLSAGPMATGLVVDASKRKYAEQTLQGGDAVSVLGYATARDDAARSTASGDLTVTRPPDGTLYLSSSPFDDAPSGRGSLLFGLLTGMVGVGIVTALFVL